ncbi:TPM domain-containing protein [Rhizobium sp. RU36D]|uniref:TPM domain-containing protein n=1 Tax=Rhizobium sp. RU36D TaxID=1907415 RepID=UPI00117B84A6|nr:TPM domain-containing protein [Rhizobium sp. RU36D]
MATISGLALPLALAVGPSHALDRPRDVGRMTLFPQRNAETLEYCADLATDLRRHEQGIELAQVSTPPKLETESEEQLAAELSDLLQACSYDGSAIKVSARSLGGASSSDGAAVVKAIMRFTGLPQNFKVIEGPVPNAAALIIRGPEGLPQRVIAYNVGFMDRVRQATENNDWASISIMAHEIGHHLSGHTLMPGGSQPPIELEADKFSGFVLQKMGAQLQDAQKAISTLVPEGDGPTHPGRGKRLVAISQGWTESCEQAGQNCDGVAVETARTEPSTQASPATPAPASPSPPAEQNTAALPTLSPSPAADGGDQPAPIVRAGQIDRLPVPDPEATPAKFDRFVYDEIGILDPAAKENLSRLSFDFAAEHNVEIVTIFAESLHGLSVEDYAYQMLRQLRVGKMDVGNGAVIVVAPNENVGGYALGTGLHVAMGEQASEIQSGLETHLMLAKVNAKNAASADLVFTAVESLMEEAALYDWAVRFQSFDELLAKDAADTQALNQSGGSYDPRNDAVRQKLLRIAARVTTHTPQRGGNAPYVEEGTERLVGPAMQVEMPGGRIAMVYVHDRIQQLMTADLREGQAYSMIVREIFFSGDTPQLALVSYDLIGP